MSSFDLDLFLSDHAIESICCNFRSRITSIHCCLVSNLSAELSLFGKSIDNERIDVRRISFLCSIFERQNDRTAVYFAHSVVMFPCSTSVFTQHRSIDRSIELERVMHVYGRSGSPSVFLLRWQRQ